MGHRLIHYLPAIQGPKKKLANGRMDGSVRAGPNGTARMDTHIRLNRIYEKPDSFNMVITGKNI